MIVGRYSGLWAREGNTFLNAQTGREHADGDASWLELNDVRLFEFGPDGRLQSIAHAAVAEHRASGWLLRKVTRTWFEERAVTQTEADEERWESNLDTAALAANASNIWRPRYMSAADLRDGIEYRNRNQLDASEFEEHYWGRWFYPLNVLALCLAAIPFAFGSLRSGGMGRRLFLGVVFALGFWLLQNQVVKMAAVFKFDYRLAYLIPPMIMLAVSWTLFHKRSG
jgi:lipopolysaccharide export system permease protein